MHDEAVEPEDGSGQPDAGGPDDEFGPTGDEADGAGLAGVGVVVRRNAGLAALIGAAASAIAIAYLWRGTQTGGAADWVLCAVMTMVAGINLAALLDARTPLVVADELGVRIRLGHQWRGLPWDAIAAVEVLPRRTPLHDGRLAFRPHSLGRALDGLEGRGRRVAALNRRMYGAALAVPMGLTTRSSADPAGLAAAIRALSDGRVGVTLLTPRPAPEPARGAIEPVPAPTPEQPEQPEDTATVPRRTPGRTAGRTLVGGLGTIVSRVAKGRGHDVDSTAPGPATEPDQPEQPEAPAALVAPLREARPGLRAEVTRDAPATTLGPTTAGATALHRDPVGSGPASPEGRELRRPGSVDLVFEPVDTGSVRPISRLGDPVEPLVIDDYPTEPAHDPVIGPELAAARTRVGLSVDELADRTRIRPHVIESIEVDDFAPCGGDFYARGHLRTLARVLGRDPVPLLAHFDNRYATAPINARRVFEAELATKTTRGIRGTVGGPSWGLLIGVVLSLVLVWGVVRFFATQPTEEIHSPAPVLNGSAGVGKAFPHARAVDPAPRPMRLTLVAAQAGSRVVVRDGDGKVRYTGALVPGEQKTLRLDPPARVRARNAGAIEVRVGGQDRGPVGELGEPGRRTVHRPRH